MYQRALEPIRPGSILDHLKAMQSHFDIEMYKTKMMMEKEKLKRTFSLISPGHFVKNDIIVDSNGTKYIVMDSNGTLKVIDWEEDKKKFMPVASAYPEGSTDPMEEELYDITPEDRKQLRDAGII